MSFKGSFVKLKQRKKLAGWLLTMVMLLAIDSTPVRAMAATDAEILAMIQNIVRVIEVIRNQINTQTVGTPGGIAPVTENFPNPVVLGSDNNSVLLLQKILTTDASIYPAGVTTGIFGSETTEGLRSFQAKFRLPTTGTFTPETKYVLNRALSATALDSYAQNYLTKDIVIEQINTAADEYLLGDVVVNGKVVFRPFPVFSASVKSSDVATLQRIMKTDPQTYRGEITGLMDTATVSGVVKLRSTYGIPFVFPADNQIDMNALLDSRTMTLLNRLLGINGAATIRRGLLQDSSATPASLVPNSSRTIQSIKATRNYRKLETTVIIVYSGRIQEVIKTTAFLPNNSLISDIANRLNRDAGDISSKITYTELYAKEPKKIEVTFKPQRKEEVDVLATYRDNTTELFQTTRDDEPEIINLYFGGDAQLYFTRRDNYIEQAQNGIVDNDLYEFIADFVGVTVERVRDIITVKVDDTRDPADSNNG